MGKYSRTYAEEYDQIQKILKNSDYNDLPKEERNRIAKYCSEQKLQILWQVLTSNSNLTCDSWKFEIRKWINSELNWYEMNWGRADE